MFGFGLLKKGFVLLVVVFVVGAVFFGPDVVSYATTSRRAIRDAIKDQVPIEFELRRVRTLIDAVMPELHANMKLVAKEEVEIDALAAEVARTSEALAAEKRRMATLASALKSGPGPYQFDRVAYTRDQVEKDLARRFERYQSTEVVLAGRAKLLATRRQSLQVAMDKLRKTQGSKAMLEDQVAAIEAQFRVIQAAQSTSELHLDESKLAQAGRVLAEVKKRLEVSQRVLDNQAEFVGDIPVDPEQKAPIADAVIEYFEKPDAAE